MASGHAAKPSPNALPQVSSTPFDWLITRDPEVRWALRRYLIRILVITNLILGLIYLSWRWTDSINWAVWWLAIPLVVAETYSFIDACLFGTTMWALKRRATAPAAPPGLTVDIFITCYNEPVELVRETARAAVAVRYPHQTWILDDGRNDAMRAMAEDEGCGYIVRSDAWVSRERHAKAGNLNNALFQTDGEFILILDADQIPRPEILDQTLGYFADEKVAFVQTPQHFYNVPPGDPLGSQAPLFYGPIQQGKDGWNAAYFCGSNAVLRREALLSIGVSRYVYELSQRVHRALAAADRLLQRAERDFSAADRERFRPVVQELRGAVRDARRDLRVKRPIQEITFGFQRRAEQAARAIVASDLADIRAELTAIPGVEAGPGTDLDQALSSLLDDDAAMRELTGRTSSPLAAIETVRQLLLAVDVDRDDEAQPVMPMATISVTEDMATAMRLHARGWKSVFHPEILAEGLAPDDLRTALQQRLRWAQGTIQVLLRENPLVVRGLQPAQRLMYFATMWSYFSGFFAIVYLLAPVLYLFFGLLPITAFSSDFFWRLVPYLVVNQLLFLVVGWGRPTWRGQQYSLALFPLWIKAVTSAIQNVYFGRKLGFVVTPKVRSGGPSTWSLLRLVQGQVIMMFLLTTALLYGLVRLALGLVDDSVPVLVNVVWAIYDLVMLSAVVDAATFRQPTDQPEPRPSFGLEAWSAAETHGRVGAGR